MTHKRRSETPPIDYPYARAWMRMNLQREAFQAVYGAAAGRASRLSLGEAWVKLLAAEESDQERKIVSDLAGRGAPQRQVSHQTVDDMRCLAQVVPLYTFVVRKWGPAVAGHLPKRLMSPEQWGRGPKPTTASSD